MTFVAEFFEELLPLHQIMNLIFLPYPAPLSDLLMRATEIKPVLCGFA